MGDNLDHFGPIDYLAVEFPDGKVGPEGFARLLGLVDSGRIRVLDLEFVAKRDDGTLERVPATELGSVDGVDMAQFDGASSGLLDPSDAETVGARMQLGALAAILVYEELSMLEVVEAWESGGAALLVEGPLTVDELDSALDATDNG